MVLPGGRWHRIWLCPDNPSDFARQTSIILRSSYFDLILGPAVPPSYISFFPSPNINHVLNQITLKLHLICDYLSAE